MSERGDAARRIGIAVAAMLILIADLAVAAARSDGPQALVPDLGEVSIPSAVTDGAAARAQGAAGCELLVDGEPLADRNHLDPEDAPPAAALYPGVRPAHSGRHFSSVVDFLANIPREPIDERAVLHNMEHGSVVVWFDEDQVDQDDLDQMLRWLRERLALGFASDARGTVFVSPSGVIGSGQAVALRAWGVAMDCDEFDVTVADRFLQDHWGSQGRSPEADLSPFPPGVLGGRGQEV